MTMPDPRNKLSHGMMKNGNEYVETSPLNIFFWHFQWHLKQGCHLSKLSNFKVCPNLSKILLSKFSSKLCNFLKGFLPILFEIFLNFFENFLNFFWKFFEFFSNFFFRNFVRESAIFFFKKILSDLALKIQFLWKILSEFKCFLNLFQKFVNFFEFFSKLCFRFYSKICLILSTFVSQTVQISNIQRNFGTPA